LWRHFVDSSDSKSPGNGLTSDGVIMGNQLLTSGSSPAAATQASQMPVNNSIRTGRIGWREIVRQP
jgi:hypothetical protein